MPDVQNESRWGRTSFAFMDLSAKAAWSDDFDAVGSNK